MSWDSFFGKQWDRNKKIDPLSHGLMEFVAGHDSHNIKIAARKLAGMTGGEGSWLGRRFGDLGDEAQKNEDDPKRGIGRAALTAGVIYGGMAAAGAGGGGAGAAAAEGGGAATGVGAGEVAAGTAGAAAPAYTTAAADSATVGGTAYSGSVPASVDLGSAGGSMSTGAGGAGVGQWGRLVGQAGRAFQQAPDDTPLTQDKTDLNGGPDLARYYAVSSRKAKTPSTHRAAAAQAMAAGAQGADPISQNGVQMAAIQALTKRLEKLRASIRALQGAKA